jgi:hypothetical protein
MTLPHEPNDELRREVAACASYGFTHEQIALRLKISADTLVKYYKYELDNGLCDANFKVAGNLFKKAYLDEDLTAIIFWLKTRAKWREKDRDEDSAKIDSVIEKLIEKLAEK